VFDIVGKRNWYFAFSLLVTIPGLIFILLTPITNGAAGIKFSIDYTGGTEWSIRFKDDTVTADAVRIELEALGQEDAQVTRTGRGFLDIRMSKLDLRDVQPAPTAGPTDAPTASPGATALGPVATVAPTPTPAPTATPDASASPAPSATPIPGSATDVPTQGEIGKIATALQAKFGPIAEQAKLSSIGILGWITLRFRDVKFGVTALVALLHDVIVVLGIFAMLGTFFAVKVDGLFVTAMLTVIGFSVHDTIVVFDRIRENRARHAGEPFAEVVNHSILQTFGRSITTSFTVVLTLTTLILFGGSATQEFVLALLIGIISGTYSSIFNASPLLVVWQEWEDRRHGRLDSPGKPSRATA
jgi:preprotein translocase subunit SecF